MRHVLYLLLIANVLYLGWNMSQGMTVAQKQPSLPPIPDGVHTLVMLQEIAGNLIPATRSEKSAGTDNQESSYSDMQQEQKTDSKNAAVFASPEQPGSRPAHACKVLGPFDEFAAAETVSDHLVSMGLIPMLRSEDSRIVDDYWVYLPGKGRQYSQKIVQQLKAENINDYYVYDTDDYLISLGTFRRIGLAEKQVENFRQMGLDAVIEKRYKTRMEHWLEISVEEQDEILLDRIAMKTPGLHINTSSCMSLASR